MIRSGVGIIAGCISAMIILIVFEGIGFTLFPPPKDFADAVKNYAVLEKLRENPAAWDAMKDKFPVAALLDVLAGFAAGSFIGAGIAVRIAGSARMTSGIIVGVILTCAAVANNLMLPHPAWFWIASLLIFLPAAYFGAKTAVRRPQELFEELAAETAN